MVPLLLSVLVQLSSADVSADMEASLAAFQKEMQAAKQKNNQLSWALAFQKRAAFLQSRGKLEEAVNSFAQDAWPQEDIPLALTSLSYFNALSAYRGKFYWEIARRPAMEDWKKQPIRFWTHAQMVQVQNAALGKAWQRRVQLESVQVTQLKDFEKFKDEWGRGCFDKLSEKDKSVRGALSFLWADFLESPENWLPQNDYWQDERRKFSQDDAMVSLKTQGDPTNPKAHSLMRAAWVYADLKTWHSQNGRAEEASEVLRHSHGELLLGSLGQMLCHTGGTASAGERNA